MAMDPMVAGILKELSIKISRSGSGAAVKTDGPGLGCSTAPAVRLIHEGNLAELAGGKGCLTLQKGQVITPAALDLARARGIEIKRP